MDKTRAMHELMRVFADDLGITDSAREYPEAVDYGSYGVRLRADGWITLIYRGSGTHDNQLLFAGELDRIEEFYYAWHKHRVGGYCFVLKDSTVSIAMDVFRKSLHS